MIQAPDNIAADADRLIGELAAKTANPPVRWCWWWGAR